MGIEPTSEAWEASLKARNATRVSRSVYARFGAYLCTNLWTNWGRIFEGGAACKCDTCKALGFPDFSTTN